jgi:hypothetical protein
MPTGTFERVVADIATNTIQSDERGLRIYAGARQVSGANIDS